MRKSILALGVIGTLLFGTGASSVEDVQTQGKQIGGCLVSDILTANCPVSSLLEKANINIKENFSKIAKMPEALKDVRFGNPVDPSTWWEGADPSAEESITFNFADPAFWMSIPNPKTHTPMYNALINPANWAQFFKPETYAGMRDLNVLSKWLENDSYAVLLDAQTYAYWMQPGAYGHLLNVQSYKQLLNGAAYETLIDTAIGNVGLTFKSPQDKLDIMGWVKSVSLSGKAEESNT